MSYPKSKWISALSKPARVNMRLFCFPFAGGAAQAFKDWGSLLPKDVQVLGVQYPGRSSRFTEPAFTAVADIAEALRSEIRPFLDKPFAFFGHSLGASISYELARLLRAEGLQPGYLLVSGRRAPHLPRNRELIYNLPEDQFRVKISELNGTPPEILEHEELMDLMAPILRADFTASETYAFHPGVKMDAPLAAFGGAKDPDVEEEAIEAWREHTDGPFSAHMLPGDHFFLNEDQSRDLLLKSLCHYLGKIAV